MNNFEATLMRRASTTYYYTALFFPRSIRKKVMTLYAFVRTADDFVDAMPQQQDAFLTFEKEWYSFIKKGSSTNPIIQNYGVMAKTSDFEGAWTTAFLSSMKQDLIIKKYPTLAQTEQYIYGSAEMIGLMMSRILGLPKNTEHAARMQGKAMQYINFLRDIPEDNALGRTYIPQEILKKHNLQDLSETTARRSPAAFCTLIREEVRRYQKWQEEASKAYPSIPRRFRIPITTAATIYAWTANEIVKNPFIVYEKKVKPGILQILYTILIQSLS